MVSRIDIVDVVTSEPFLTKLNGFSHENDNERELSRRVNPYLNGDPL